MGTIARRMVLTAAMAVFLPSLADAQMQSWKDVQVADLVEMKDKFVGLAGAFSEAQWEYRPMEGVRSTKDVFALMIAETHMFPVAWGYPAPAGAAGFGAGVEAASIVSVVRLSGEDSAHVPDRTSHGTPRQLFFLAALCFEEVVLRSTYPLT